MATTYKFKAYYKKNGVGATQSPAPVCTVINMADDSKVADAQATVASTNMPGLYSYSYTGNDGLDLVAYFHTTDAAADEADVASYVNDKITTNLNADVAGVEAKIDTIDGVVDAILVDTSALSDGVTLADDAISAAKFDESTAFPLKAADTGSTQVARTGADGDTLEKLSDEIATVQADLDNPDQYKADVSGIPAAVWGYATRTLSSFGTLISDIWSHATRTLSAFGFTVATQSDANVTAIKAKTDNLPTSPAATGDAMTLTAAYDHAKDDVLTPLGVVDGVVDAIKLKTDNIPATPANEATLTAIKGTGWSDETLVALMNAIEAISVGSGATPQQIWEYVARTLTNPDDYKADVSGLATTTHLQEVENKVDAVGTSVATPATVWAYPDRTLTVSSIRPRPLVDGDQFTIYKDATINIPITKLGDISVYDNLWFTIKREQDLESADDQSVVHMDLLTGMLYLNKQAAVAAQGSITIVDATTGSINILITKEGAALLPVYAREPLRWEVKGIHGEIVDILLQGSCFIQPAVSRKIS